jgi:hypothetical protein
MYISTGIFPERLKYAVMKPLNKKGDKVDIKNYRPISMLTLFSEVIEKVMYCRLSQHLLVNNILVHEQFGFRKKLLNKSCCFFFYNWHTSGLE